MHLQEFLKHSQKFRNQINNWINYICRLCHVGLKVKIAAVSDSHTLQLFQSGANVPEMDPKSETGL